MTLSYDGKQIIPKRIEVSEELGGQCVELPDFNQSIAGSSSAASPARFWSSSTTRQDCWITATSYDYSPHQFQLALKLKFQRS